MRKLLLFLTLISILSCNESRKNQLKNNSNIEYNNSIITLNIDTIVERTDHTRLDLEKHQLFIDTTGYSTLNKNLQNWNSTTKMEIEANIENFKIETLDSEIPTKWITIRKYKNDFFNYDRCDGNDPRIEIIGNALIFHGIHEKSIFQLDEILKEKSSWTLKSSYNFPLEFSLEKTDIKDVFIFQLKGPNGQDKSYVTPFENLKNFDQLVNHCTTEKVYEFNKFENP